MLEIVPRIEECDVSSSYSKTDTSNAFSFVLTKNPYNIALSPPFTLTEINILELSCIHNKS